MAGNQVIVVGAGASGMMACDCGGKGGRKGLFA